MSVGVSTLTKYCSGSDAVVIHTGVDELASIESNEVVDFRKHMHDMCERTARFRDSQVVHHTTCTVTTNTNTTNSTAAAAASTLCLKKVSPTFSTVTLKPIIRFLIIFGTNIPNTTFRQITVQFPT